MGLAMTTASSEPRSTMSSIWRSRSCSRMRSRARSITCFTEIGSRLTGAARPNVRRCERSEEHTSELQSHVNLVCRLLLEKKKKKEKKKEVDLCNNKILDALLMTAHD